MVFKACFYIACLALCLSLEYINGYKTYDVESDKICCLECANWLIRQPINTGSNGIIVRATNNDNSYLNSFTGKKKTLKCHFQIETGHRSQFPGLFAVVQKLNLRKAPSGDCIDYVRMRQVDKDIFSEISSLNINLKKNKYDWATFCGNLSARRDGNEEKPLTPNMAITGFSSSNDINLLEVEIYIDKQPLLNENLSLEILFTPFTSCPNKWSEWSDYKECGFSNCIKKQNFNDGFVNCPYIGCRDEDGCDTSITEGGELPGDLRTKVTLTAVTSIFCSFFLFLGCIWCCRYFEMLCWSANDLLGRPNPVELSPMRPSTPTALPDPPSPSKDLPPAYDTLFPDSAYPNRWWIQ